MENKSPKGESTSKKNREKKDGKKPSQNQGTPTATTATNAGVTHHKKKKRTKDHTQ